MHAMTSVHVNRTRKSNTDVKPNNINDCQPCILRDPHAQVWLGAHVAKS